MKKLFLPVFLSVLMFAGAKLFAQTIDSFDTFTDSTYTTQAEGAASTIDLSTNTTDFKEGTGSLDEKVTIGAFHDWGSFYSLHTNAPTDQPFDWTQSTDLKIWIKVKTAPKHPEALVWRFQILDKPTPDANEELWVYENATIIDSVHDWVQLDIPLYAIKSDGSINPGDSGFVIAPTSWNQTSNDKVLNLDKIIGYDLSVVTTGADADSLELAYDGLERTGVRSIPHVIFNGVVVPKDLQLFTWGQSSVEVVDGAGVNPKTAALKWTQGDEWSNGWTGAGWNLTVPFNMSGNWDTDSLQFDLKTSDNVDTLILQFEDGVDKVGYWFKPNNDGQWHHYAYALKDFKLVDDTMTTFDNSNVTVFQFMADANGVAGNVIWFDNMWTGHPTFDVIPPDAPQNVIGTAASYANLITWTDVPGETGDTYNVYYSKNPITDINAAGVDLAGSQIARGTQSFNHVLRAPLKDQEVTYYYAVTSTDQAGNESALSSNTSAITNTAKGYAVIEPTTINFKADGDLSEWASVTPFKMLPSDGSGTVVTNTKIDGDADCSALVYMAIDKTNLYVAFDITDDVVYSDSTLDSWLNDCADMFIGLYNMHGKTHNGYKRGEEPDYHFRFAKNDVILDNMGGKVVMYPGDNYYWAEQFPTGYRIEAKIPLAKLASIGGDSLFVPTNGMRLPLDFEISDNDGNPSTAPTREGQLDFSPVAEGNSYASVSVWAYTWIGDWITAVNDQTLNVNSYQLNQNYPNPFNPTTQINYSIQKSGLVTLKIYDVLGRQVATLVNQVQNAGSHTINFDASKLSSGVYFYRLDAGNYQSVKKMMLLK